MSTPHVNQSPSPPHPNVDDVELRALHKKTRYAVDTADGWSLNVTRYRPLPQTFTQPLFGEPILLVHGFSQNRHAWTSGEFVKNLLYFGIDIHILELRGHGRSSPDFVRERAARFGRTLPVDLDWDWDIDSYFLYDLPAAVTGVRRITRRDRIFYCGHSLGGMLGYGYAGIHPEHFDGLITIGAPAQIGKGNAALTLLAYCGPGINLGVDTAIATINATRRAGNALKRIAKRPTSSLESELKYRYLPVDKWLKVAADGLLGATQNGMARMLLSRGSWLTKLDRASSENMQWLLREGGEREPRRVVDELLRWVRNRELVCYRTGYNFQQGFKNIKVPMAIIFGDLDPLATLESTRQVYRTAASDYLLWRPVKGNSHVELTMGHDIRQICYDIKNLIEYARTHRDRPPSLPRVHE